MKPLLLQLPNGNILLFNFANNNECEEQFISAVMDRLTDAEALGLFTFENLRTLYTITFKPL